MYPESPQKAANEFNSDSLDSLPVQQQPVYVDDSSLQGDSTPNSSPIYEAPRLPKKAVALRHKAIVVSAFITLLVFLITGVSAMLLSRNQRTSEAPGNTVPVQDIDFSNYPDAAKPAEITGDDQALLVRGDVITKSSLKVSSDGAFVMLQPQALTENRVISLPDSSGTLCLDSNNCNFATQADIQEVQNQLGQIVIPSIPDIPASSLVNRQVGAVSIQGTTNQIRVTTSNGVIRLSTPQDLALTSSPTFSSLFLNNNLTVNGDSILGGGLNLGGTLTLNLDCSSLVNGGTLTTDASGQVICAADDGGAAGTAVTTPGGTPGAIPVFTGATTIADSIISQALGTITISGALNVAGNISADSLTLATPLGVGSGGTGATSFTANGVLYGNGSGSINATAAPAAGQILLGNGSGVPTFTTVSGDIAITGAGVTTIQPNSVALGVDTTGNYVSGLATGNGLSVSGTAGEGWTPTVSLSLQPNKGLEVDANGLSLIDCATDEILKYNGSGQWTCASDGAGAGVTAVGALDSQAKSADGAVITGNTIYLQTADATFPGLVSTGAQTFAGAKTFNGLITANGSLTIQTGDVLTINGDSFTDLTGTGLMIGGGALQTTLGTSIQDSEVDDNLTISSAGSVDWTALTAYPIGCLAGQAVVTIGDTLTCASFATGAGQAFVQGGNSFGSLATLGTNDAFDLAFETNGTEKARLTTTGQLQLNVQGVTGGLLLGGDVNLYRSVANQLRSDDDIASATQLLARIATAGQVNIGTSSTIPTITFGNAGDTNLYRSGTSALATDDAFTVTGLLTANGNLTVQTGDTFTINGDGFTDLTGNGLQVASGALTLALQPNKGLEVDANGLSLVDCATDEILKYNGSGQWACATDGAGSGVTTIGALDGQAKSANGATISGNTLYLQTADASFPGLVSTGSQTFAGDKTFNGQVTIAASGTGLSVTNNATIGGQLSLTASGSGGGIVFGGDTNLYRAGANELRTDHNFQASAVRAIFGGNETYLDAGTLYLYRGSAGNILESSLLSDSLNRLEINSDGRISWGSGSSAPDTNLYRSAANTLATDDALTVAGLLTANGGITLQTGDAFTINSDAFTDLTGDGLQVSSGALGVDATVCRTSGNCAGSGGGVTTPGGTANRLAVFTGSQTIADSWILQNGSTVQIDNTRNLELLGGDLTVNGDQTVSGSVTLSALSNGFLEVNGSGLVSVGTIDLGTDTNGSYVASITAGNGISGSASGEGSTPTIALGTLTADWIQSGGFDVVYNNAGAEIRMLESVGGSFYGTFDVGDLSADQTYTFLQGGTVITSGNVNSFATTAVAAGAGLTGGGTTGALSLDIGAGNGIQVDTDNISVIYGSSANTAVEGDTALMVSAGTNLTGGGTITLGAGGAVTLNVTDNPTFAGDVAVQGGSISLGQANVTTGSVDLFHASSSFGGSLRIAGLGQATIYTLPDPGSANATICLSSGNCAGAGGGVTTSGGTPNRLAKFTSGQNIEDSTITDDGVNVTTSVDLVVQGGGATLGTSLQDGSLIVFDNGQTATLQAALSTANRTYTLPDGSGEFCIRELGNCSGGGGGNAPVGAQYLTLALDGTLTAERVLSFNSTNFSVTDGGANGNYSVNTVQDINITAAPTFAGLTLNGNLNLGANTIQGSTATINFDNFDVASNGNITAGTYNGQTISTSANFTGTLTVAGLATFNGGITLQTGDTFTINGDGFTDLTGNGLQVASGALTLALQPNKGLEVDANGLSLVDCATDEILKYNGSGQWACATDGAGSGVTTIGALDGQAKSANGATISGNTLYLQTADASFPGLVSTGSQTFAGDKTFNNSVDIQGHAAIGSAATVDSLATLKVEETRTTVGSSPIFGITSWFELNPSTAPGANNFSVANYSGLAVTAGNSQNFNVVIAQLGEVWNEGTGIISTAEGIRGNVNNASSGTITGADGGELQVLNTGTGTITNARGLNIGSATNSGGGTITNNYGIDVQSQTAGATDIGIRIAAADTYTLQLSGTAGTANTGITFGTDTNLYRSAANVLTTDDWFHSATNSTAAGIVSGAWGAAGQTVIGAVGPSSQAGILFGSANDTNLYRSAANTLATDDALVVSGLLTANGNLTLQTGDTLTVNGDGFTDLTGDGLQLAGSSLAVDSTVCRTSGNCAGTGGNGDILQGGNSFGTAMTIGTNDNFNLNFETNGVTVATLTTAGQLQLPVQGSSGGLIIGGDVNLYRGNADVLQTNDSIRSERTGASDNAFAASLTTDTNNRIGIRADGQINWGSGSGAVDTNLYRSAANTLMTDDAFTAGGIITANAGIYLGTTAISNNGTGGLTFDTNGRGTISGTSGGLNTALTLHNTSTSSGSGSGIAFSSGSSLTMGQIRSEVGSSTTDGNLLFFTRTAGSITEKLRVTNTGNVGIGLTSGIDSRLTFAADTTAAGGILFGTDTNLYRSAADTLRTDDRLQVASGIDLLSDGGSAASGIRFGSAQDANIYRTAANTLRFNGGSTQLDNGIGSGGITFGSTLGTSANLYRSGNDQLTTDDALVVSGLLTANGNLTLQTGDTLTVNGDGFTDLTGDGLQLAGSSLAVDSTVCRTSGNCAGTGGNGDILQGGNSFGTAMTIGTNDNFNLNLETNGITVATLTTAGQLQLATAGSAGGLLIGGDSTLYRSGSGALTTGGQFNAIGLLTAGNNNVQIGAVGPSSKQGLRIGPGTGDVNLYRDSADVLKTDDNFIVQTATNSTTAFQIQNAAGNSNLFVADTVNSRVGINTASPTAALDVTGGGKFSSNLTVGGTIFFGTGDVNLYRSAANTLQTDDSLFVSPAGAGYGVLSTVQSGNIGFGTRISGDANDRINFDTTASKINFGPGNAAVDTNLYRSAANTLRTDTTLQAGWQVVAREGTAAQVRVGSSSTTPEILFGSANDTNLYRSAANTLRTDDALVVGTLGSGGTTVLCSNAGQISTCGSSAGSGNYIFNTTSSNLQTNANIAIQSASDTSTTATFRARATQTAEILRVENSSGGSLFVVANNGDVRADGSIRVTRASGNTGFATRVTGDTGDRFNVDVNGNLLWGSGTGAGDTNLYRSAADVLRTDDQLQTGLNVVAAIGSTDQVNVGIAGLGGGITFGNAQDTNLYRSAANTLRTDDAFTANGALGSNAFLWTSTTSNEALYLNRIGATSRKTQIVFQDDGTNTWFMGPDFSDAGAQDFFLRDAIAGANRLTVNSSGLVNVVADGSSAGLQIGSDTQLYRRSTNQLSLGDNDLFRAANSSGDQLYLQADPGSVYLNSINNAVADWTLASRVSGDSDQRFVIEANGGMSWGGGFAARDTFLYRSNPGVLETSGRFKVLGNAEDVANGNILQVGGSMTSAVNSQLGLRVTTSIAPASASTRVYTGIQGIPSVFTNANLSGASIRGVNGAVYADMGAGNTLGSAIGLFAGNFMQSGTIGVSRGLEVADPTGGGAVTTNFGIFVNPMTAGTNDYGIAVGAADTQTLWISQNTDSTTAAGGIAFGSSRDTNLYRSAANVLKTDDTFDALTYRVNGTAGSSVTCSGGQFLQNQVVQGGIVTGGTCASASGGSATLQAAYDNGNTITTTDARDLSVTLANTTTDSNFIINVATGSTGALKVQNNGSDVMNISSAGQLQLATQGSTGGLLIGGDANLYRSAADQLKTDSYMVSDDGFIAHATGFELAFAQFSNSSDTQPRFWINTNGHLGWGPGGSTAADTNLYRSAANTLMTDDALIVSGLLTAVTGLQVGSSTPDSTGELLRLDDKNTVGDPTGAEGGMYYNSALKAFRCYQNGQWQSCGPIIRKVTADVVNSTTTLSDVTDLTFPMAANTDYSLKCNVVYTSAATTTGIKVTVNGPSGPTYVAGMLSTFSAATTQLGRSFSAYNGGTATTGVGAAATVTPGTLDVTVRNGATAGNLVVRFASEVAASQVDFKAGSSCQLLPL